MAAEVTVNLLGHVGTGLILEHPSGITYVNQSGGVYCLQPCCEGIFVSWFNDVEFGTPTLISTQEALAGLPWEIASSAMTEAEADAADAVLRVAPAFQGVRVDRTRLAESWEAWVRVVIEPPHQLGSVLHGVAPFPERGVLVWNNSD